MLKRALMEVFHAFNRMEMKVIRMHAYALTNSPLYLFNEWARLCGHVFKIHSRMYCDFFCSNPTAVRAIVNRFCFFLVSLLFATVAFRMFVFPRIFWFCRVNEYRLDIIEMLDTIYSFNISTRIALHAYAFLCTNKHQNQNVSAKAHIFIYLILLSCCGIIHWFIHEWALMLLMRKRKTVWVEREQNEDLKIAKPHQLIIYYKNTLVLHNADMYQRNHYYFDGDFWHDLYLLLLLLLLRLAFFCYCFTFCCFARSYYSYIWTLVWSFIHLLGK